MFLLIAISIWAGAHIYIGTRLISFSGLSGGHLLAAWGGVGALLFLGPAAFWTHEMEGWELWKIVLAWAGYTAAGYSSVLFGLTVIRDLSWLAVLLVNWLGGVSVGWEVIPVGAPRRVLFNWTSVAVVAGASFLTVYGIVMTRVPPLVKEIPMKIPGLPAAFEGLRIVEICDLHLSRTTPRGFMQRLVTKLNELDPDLLVFVGDFGEGRLLTHRDNALLLKETKARYGRFFVTGNHEYYSDFPEWIRAAEESGFDNLNNEGRFIRIEDRQLYVAGISDRDARHVRRSDGDVSNLDAAAAGLGKADFSILLAHQPYRPEVPSKLGFDLMISGHTQGGQIFPYTYVVQLFFKHSRGLHDVAGMKIYVSQGTGYWGPPLRIGSRAEISILVLRSAD